MLESGRIKTKCFSKKIEITTMINYGHDKSRGVTVLWRLFKKCSTISTHTPLARRDFNELTLELIPLAISTHTPLARRDIIIGVTKFPNIISTHTPLARRDLQLWMKTVIF